MRADEFVARFLPMAGRYGLNAQDVLNAYARAERPRLAPSTVTLTVNYLAAAKLGNWLEARVRIDRLGGRTAYTSGGIWHAEEQVATMSGVFAIRR